jgi:hypothetical protein
VTSKTEFDAARQSLHSEADIKPDSDWRLYHTVLSQFDNIDAWTLLNELIQNAVDTRATDVTIKLLTDELEFRHNGKEPLSQGSVEGLCAFSKSTKGLDSVGFMGIGFKSFLRFFYKVTIYDQGIKFAIDIKLKDTGNPDLRDLYRPQWVEINDVVKGETVFRFSIPHGGAMETLRNDLENFDSIRLAVLGMRGLKQVSIDERAYIIEKTDHGVKICLGERPPRRFMVLEEEVHFSTAATQELKKVRDSSSEEKTTTRKVRLVKEFEVEFSEKDGGISRTKPISMDNGQAFCLVPLEGFSFPFKFGLDTDWLLKPDRSKLHSGGKLWHQEILAKVPILIRRFIQSLPKEDMDAEEWAKCLDIFPDDETEIDKDLRFLGTNHFKELMKDELAEIEFILCRDGKFRNPTDTRDFPPRLVSYPRMTKTTHNQLADECCVCDILDLSAISDNTKNYLYNIREKTFLVYPNESEIDVEKVKSLWDREESTAYRHVLDIFTTINYEDGIEITPLQNGKWAILHDENLIFQTKPKSGSSKERSLFDELKVLIPSISSRREVHDELKIAELENSLYKPGGKWRANFNDNLIDFDIPEEISRIQISQKDVNLVIAIFHFSLRTNQPNLVKFIHNDSGVVSCNDCFIGEPFETNKSILKLVKGKTQSDKINTIAKKLKKTKVTRKFLIDCGVRLFTPTFHETTCNKPTEASSFIGRSVGKPTIMGEWRATWSGEKKDEGVPNAWTLNDYIWPIDFSEVDDIEPLSKLLSDPPEDLRKAMKDKKYAVRRMTWYYAGIKEDPKPRKEPCKWLIDLRETAWVKCTGGGGYRMPRDAPLGSGGNSEAIEADIDDEVVEFYSSINVTFGSDLKGMSPEQRIDFWKRERFIDDKFFIKTLEESGFEGDELANALLQSNFRTQGGIAPLERFIVNCSSSFGGYFGSEEDLPSSVKQFLNKNAITLPDSITSPMLETYINSFSSRKEKDYLGNIKFIRTAYSELIDLNKLDLNKLKFRTIDGGWVEPGIDDLYIQLTADSFRFKDFKEQMLDLYQFPQNMEFLREIYEDESPILLIDNQIDFDDGEYGETHTVVNLTRVAMSMNSSGIDFVIKQSEEDFVEVEFEGRNLQLPYLIKDEGSIIHLYVNADTKAWAQSIAEFFGNILGVPHAISNLNQALLYSDEEEEFEERYSQLCDNGKFEAKSFDEARDIVLSNSENSNPPEGGPESDLKTDRTPIIREPTTDTSDEESDDGKDDSKPSIKKKKDGKKKATKKLTVRKPKKGPSTKEIGDKGEDIVKQHLTEKGWKVINRNEFYGKPVEGSDLVAEKDGKKRIIEVKSTTGKWDGKRSISWKQAVHALQHHDPENLHGRGHVTCWVYVVERVLSDVKPRIAPIDWCRLEPEFDFPLEWKESILGEEE